MTLPPHSKNPEVVLEHAGGEKKQPLGVVFRGFVQGRRGGRRGVGQEAVILGMPFRAGAAHIVQVRPVGAARFARSVPQLAENLRQITPHETLPLPLRWLFCPKLPPLNCAPAGTLWLTLIVKRWFQFQTGV